MLTAAAALMVGYYIIDANNLYADTHDFNGHGGFIAAAVDGMHMGPFRLPFNLGGVRSIAAWFIWTGLMAGIEAKRGAYASHRQWSIRHIGAGLWVAMQRPLFAAVRVGQVATLGLSAAGTPDAQADGFYNAAYLTTAIYFAAAEWAARDPSPMVALDTRGENETEELAAAAASSSFDSEEDG